MLNRILWLIAGFPAAVLLVTLALANRHKVKLVLNPFKPESPDIYVELPFYFYLFGMLVIGVVLGGIATWFSQGQWRRRARKHGHESVRWQAEAERLAREREHDADMAAGGGRALVAVKR